MRLSFWNSVSDDGLYIYHQKIYIFFDIFNSTRSISQLIDPAFGWGGDLHRIGEKRSSEGSPLGLHV